MSKEEYFLKYNKDEIFKNLLATEGHFRNLEQTGFSSGDKEHEGCLIKHLGDAESHADEATSHSLMVKGEESSKKFKELRDGLRAFRKKLQPGPVSPVEGIRETRKLRRQFESFNPEYDVTKCLACGAVEEIMEKLKIAGTSLAEIEEESADKMLEVLARKHGVPKPKLVLAEECSDPQFGVYQEGGPIVLCRGGLNSHVLSHEFAHYLQKMRGEPISEEFAEKFSLAETRGKEINLYSDKRNHKFGEIKTVVTVSDLLKYWGPQHLGKGIERGLEEVDRVTGRAALPPHERPSLWGNVGMSVIGALGAVFLPAPWDLVLAVWGGHHSTTLWDYVEEYVAPAAAIVYRPAGASTSAARFVKPTLQVIPQAIPQVIPQVTPQKGKYQITG